MKRTNVELSEMLFRDEQHARTNAHYTLALVEEDRYGKTD